MEMKPYDAIIKIDEPDFMAKVENGILFLPKALYDFLRSYGYNSVEEFVCVLVGFPTSFVTTLGWTYEQLDEAKEKLREALKGLVPDHYFDPPSERKQVYEIGRASCRERV